MNNPEDKLILIVEDDETVVEFLKFAIETEKFRTIVAKNGDEAIKIALSSKPDLVILDMMIPGKSGFEVIRSLQEPEYRNIPILVVTGRFIDEKTKQLVQLEYNVKEYIVKPIKSQYLIYKIHSLLGTVSPTQKSAEEKKKEFIDKIKPE
jgi:DNA-binding response OmpR family regulator